MIGSGHLRLRNCIFDDFLIAVKGSYKVLPCYEMV